MSESLSAADFSHLITTRSLTVNFQGKTFTFLKDHPTYIKVLMAIREGKWPELPNLLQPAKAVEVASYGDLKVRDNQVFLQIPGKDLEWPVPSGLNETILHYLENNLPFQPLVKFAVNLSQNPSYRSVQQLFNFLERHHYTLTEGGNFIAYKGVFQDSSGKLLDDHSKTFDNSIGNVVKMDRNEVEDDPNKACSPGLHVSNYDYQAKMYSDANHVHVFVEVNPRDVVSVPFDYNCQKMRVCEYKVLGMAEVEFKEDIYKSPTQSSFEEQECYDCGEDDCPLCCEEDKECPNCGEEDCLDCSDDEDKCYNCCDPSCPGSDLKRGGICNIERNA